MKITYLPVVTVLFGTTVIGAAPAGAAVSLSPLFSNGMVLQRNLPCPVWGKADPGEEVTVSLAGKSAKAVADPDGDWKVKLASLQVAESLEMTVAGTNTIVIKNVAVGEVWLASGQSNMSYQVSASKGASEAFKSEEDPGFRLFLVKSGGAGGRYSASWQNAKRGSIGGFPAVAYFFARELRQNLKVPIGIIGSSVPGTAAQAWTSKAALEADPEFKKTYIEPDEKRATAYSAALEIYQKETLPAWEKAAQEARAVGGAEPAKPKPPSDGLTGGKPNYLFDSMIAPLIPYGLAGAVWYQGEGNGGSPKEYVRLFPTMINDWRTRWNQPALPFGFVALANLGEQQLAPSEGGWAKLREAQRLTLSLPQTGMASAADLGESYELHPPNKIDVGKRLALWALATVYGQKLEYSGPIYKSMKVEGESIRLDFTHTGGGLQAKDTTQRFDEEPLPRRYPPEASHYSQLAMLKSAGLLEGCPQAYDDKVVLNRMQAAILTQFATDRATAAGDASLEKWGLPDGVARKKLQSALANLQRLLAPQMARIKTPWNGELTGFALAGADGKFVWAQAKIEGQSVLVKSPDVPSPVSVRYNWSANPIGNLYNTEGLPAASFSTDDKW